MAASRQSVNPDQSCLRSSGSVGADPGHLPQRSGKRSVMTDSSNSTNPFGFPPWRWGDPQHHGEKLWPRSLRSSRRNLDDSYPMSKTLSRPRRGSFHARATCTARKRTTAPLATAGLFSLRHANTRRLVI